MLIERHTIQSGGTVNGMYSLLMYFISSKVIDIVEIGFESTKSVMIISDDGRTLADEIFKKLGRTVTFMSGQGLKSYKIGVSILSQSFTTLFIFLTHLLTKMEP